MDSDTRSISKICVLEYALNTVVSHIKGDVTIVLEQYGDLITISDLREILSIGRNAAYDLLNCGVIPAFRIGRNWKIPKDAVIFYLNQWQRTDHVT